MRQRLIVVVVLLLLLLPVVGWATVHYVSPSGSATWANSTSISTPCNLATANTNAQAGDTVYLLDGTYSTAIAPSNSGTSDSRLIYQAYTTHSAVLSVASSSAINLDSKNYITISGVKITSAAYHGINADNSNHVTITECLFDNCITDRAYSVIIARNSTNFIASSNRLIDNVALSGIRWSGENAEIYDNYISGGVYDNVAIVVIHDANISSGQTKIHHNTITGINASASDTSKSYEAISVTSAGDTDPRMVKHVEITDNIITNNYGRRHRIVIYGAEDILVARNKLVGNHTYGINVDVGSKDVTVCYNYISDGDVCDLVNIGGGNIDVRQSTGGCATCTDLENIRVINNTVTNNDSSDGTHYHTGIFFYCASDASFTVNGVYFKNNIIKDNYNSSSMGYESVVSYDTTPTITNLVFDHNDYCRTSNTANFVRWRGTVYSMSQFGNYQTASSQDSNSITQDPLLTSTYHLSAGSPCIDAGIKVAGVHFGDYWKDLDGNSDPWGSAPDIGCYEYNTGEVGWTPACTVGSSGCDYTSIQAVFDNEDLEPDDIIEIRADTPGGTKTYLERIVWGSNDGGSEGHPVILKGRAGDTIIINGTSHSNCIYTQGVDYVKIQNIQMTGASGQVCNISNSDGVIITGCKFYNLSLSSGYSAVYAASCSNFICVNNTFDSITAQAGIYWSGNTSTISNNTFIDGNYISSAIDIEAPSNTNSTDLTVISHNTFLRTNETGTYRGDGHCIGLAGGTSESRPIKHVNIVDNEMINCGGAGGGGKRITVYNSEDVDVLRNVIRECYTFGIAIDTNCYDITVAYNELVGNSISSSISTSSSKGMIQVSQNTGGCTACTQTSNIKVVNNTIVNNDDTNSPTGRRGAIHINCANDSSFELSNVIVENNVVSENFKSASNNGYVLSTAWGSAPTVNNINIDYNCYYKTANTSYFINYNGNVYGVSQFATYQSTEGQDADSLVSNPLLSSNYHLLPNSPCINAGTIISGFHETALDIDKQPILGTPDIGCDERKALWWDGRRWHMQRMY